jgi:hypothetical protein
LQYNTNHANHNNTIRRAAGAAEGADGNGGGGGGDDDNAGLTRAGLVRVLETIVRSIERRNAGGNSSGDGGGGSGVKGRRRRRDGLLLLLGYMVRTGACALRPTNPPLRGGHPGYTTGCATRCISPSLTLAFDCIQCTHSLNNTRTRTPAHPLHASGPSSAGADAQRLDARQQPHEQQQPARRRRRAAWAQWRRRLPRARPSPASHPRARGTRARPPTPPKRPQQQKAKHQE